MKNANRAARVIVGCVVLLGVTFIQAEDWPQWRGPLRNNKAPAFKEPGTWPKELTQKWKVKVGLGDAGPVLVGDKVYSFTREDNDEVIRCLEAVSGKEVWMNKYAAKTVTGAAKGHPGPRSTPVAGDGKICTFGVDGQLSCLDLSNGKLFWRKETKAYPKFFTSASPVIDEGKVITSVGTSAGSGGLFAYDLTTGDEKWKWTGEGPAYGSPVLATIDGTKQVITLMGSDERGSGSLVGVNAADGKLLWKTPFKSRYNSETPVVDGSMVFCSGPGAGSVAFKIEKKGEAFEARQVWKKTDADGMYITPVLKDGLLYGINSAKNIFCQDAQTGEVLWTDKTGRGECGEILDAGAVLIALTSDMHLVVFKPGRKGFEEVANYKVGDSPTWAPPIITDNRIFVKDKDSLILWTVE